MQVGLTGPRISYRSEIQAKIRKIIAPQRYTGIVKLQKLARCFFGGKRAGREPGACLTFPTSKIKSLGYGAKK
jgi:hypothetical protein